MSNSSCGRVFPRDLGIFISRDGDILWKDLGGTELTQFKAVSSFSVVIKQHRRTEWALRSCDDANPPELTWGTLIKLSDKLSTHGHPWDNVEGSRKKGFKKGVLGCFCHRRSSTVQTKTPKLHALGTRQSSSKSHGMWSSSLSISKGNPQNTNCRQ